MPRKSNGLGKDESSIVRLRVPNDVERAWADYCEKHGATAAEGLRAVLQFLVTRPEGVQEGLNVFISRVMRARDRPSPSLATEQAANDDDQPPRRVVTDRVETERKRRLEVKLTPSEYDAVSEAAQERGCSSQHWVTSMVRASLTHGHLFGAEEMKAFGESSYQLMAIGRNLNQITRQINADPDKHLHRVTAEALAKLEKRIDDHRYQVHRALYACSHRWELARP